MSNTCDWKKMNSNIFILFFLLLTSLLKHSENDDVFYKV